MNVRWHRWREWLVGTRWQSWRWVRRRPGRRSLVVGASLALVALGVGGAYWLVASALPATRLLSSGEVWIAADAPMLSPDAVEFSYSVHRDGTVTLDSSATAEAAPVVVYVTRGARLDIGSRQIAEWRDLGGKFEDVEYQLVQCSAADALENSVGCPAVPAQRIEWPVVAERPPGGMSLTGEPIDPVVRSVAGTVQVASPVMHWAPGAEDGAYQLSVVTLDGFEEDLYPRILEDPGTGFVDRQLDTFQPDHVQTSCVVGDPEDYCRPLGLVAEFDQPQARLSAEWRLVLAGTLLGLIGGSVTSGIAPAVVRAWR